MPENPTVRFHLRSGATLDAEDDTIEDILDVINRLFGPRRQVQFGDVCVDNHSVLAVELV